MALIILIKINKDDNNVDEKVDNCFEVNYFDTKNYCNCDHMDTNDY